MTQPITFANSTSRFSLPMLFQGQAQKEFYFNEAMSLVDALLFPVVEGESPVAPANPIEGEAWLVAIGASGDWVDQEHSVAIAIAGSWNFVQPGDGMVLFDKTAGQTVRFENSWIRAAEPTTPAGGSVIDQEARAAISQIIEILRVSAALPSN
jgi:hypothetical protein